MKKQTNPALWVPSLYFAMGLPFVAISQASSLMYSGMGISDTQIAFWTTLVLLPYSLKPLWSPLLEMFKTKKYFIVLTQLLSGITFALVAMTLPLDNFFTYTIALLGIVGLSGSTHDIATDGLYLNVLTPKRQAEFVGWQGASYNIAKIVSAGGLVYIAGELELEFGVVNAWSIVMGLYGVILILIGLLHIKTLPSGDRASSVANFSDGFDTLVDSFKTFFQKKYIFAHILFIILYRFAEGFAIKISPLFLKAPIADGGLALSTSDIGVITGVYGAAAFVGGSILGGYYIAAKGLKKSILYLALIFNIPFIAYALLAYFQPSNYYVIASAVTIEYFGYGFGFVGIPLFIMQQIAPGKYRMAHYAFASGAMNLGFMIPSSLSGFISDQVGYQQFFLIVALAMIPSVLAAKLVPFTYADPKPDSKSELKAK